MVCKNCGHDNPDASNFCGHCGWALSEKAEEGKGQQNKRKETGKRGTGCILKVLLIGAVALAAAVLLLGLFAGPSVTDVEKEIESLGAVSVNSEEQLLKVTEMYEGLSEEEQTRVSNAEVLMAASEEITRQKELLSQAKDSIDSLGQITLNSRDAIAAAREKYDCAAEYDVNHQLKEQEAVLVEAEADIAKLIKEQEATLEYALSGIGNVTSHFFTGDFSWGESSFQTQIDKLQNNEDRQQYADEVMQRICEWAQVNFDKGSYVNAVTVLQRCEFVKKICGDGTAAQMEELKETFVRKLNDKAPKNGEILERTFNKGTNSFTITVGAADTCVKIESVNDPEKYAVIYIRANDKATLYNIKNDEYRVKYTTGPVWYGEEELFGPDAPYILWHETIEPEASTSGSYRTWTQYTWEIEYGYGSDYGVQNMKPGDF